MFRHVSRRFRPWSAASLLASLILSGLVVTGCGGDDAPARSVRIDAAADGSLRFARAELQTPPGATVIEMANPSQIPHAVAIRGDDTNETGQTVGNAGTSRVKLELKPGRYALVCPVGGHEQAGMVATLVVR